MKRMVIDKPTKIILDGLEFLFESGDTISVRDRKEVIKEAIEDLRYLRQRLNDTYEKLEKEESHIEKYQNKIAQRDTSPDKVIEYDDLLDAAVKRRRKFEEAISILEIIIARKTGELDKYGSGTVRKFIQGNKEEREAEEKEEKRQKQQRQIELIENNVEELENKLDDKKETYEDYKKEHNIITGENGEYLSPSDNKPGEYDILTTDQEQAISKYTQEISQLEQNLQELESEKNELIEFENQAEKIDDEYVENQELPDMTDSILTKDELKSGVMKTSSDIYDDNGMIEIADEFSDLLINGGFQPKELGSYSDMVENLVDLNNLKVA